MDYQNKSSAINTGGYFLAVVYLAIRPEKNQPKILN
jgi:hypothetical protein